MKNLLGIVLLALMINWKDAFAITAKGKNSRIVIIGAGASGLATAVRLLEYGFKNVVILEADSRIGGRIHTIPFGKNVIDLGAQWCHGEKGNVVYDMAYKKGLLQHSDSVTENTTYIRSNRQVLPVRLNNRLERITETIKKRFENVSQLKVSMGSYWKTQFNKILNQSKNKDIDRTIAREYYDTVEKEQSVDEAADTLNQVSAWDSNLYMDIKGDNALHWKDKGYKAFLDLLIKKSKGKEFGVLQGKLKLRKSVKRINWKQKNKKTLIELEDGQQIAADHVIVTVSLGVLKAKLNSMFSPQLPVLKRKIIKSLQFGAFNKIFLEFPSRFWPKNMGMMYFLWRKNDLKALRSTKYAWLDSLFGFHTLPYQPNVLEGWINGPNSRAMEKKSLSEIKDGCLFLLKKFLGIDIPEPKTVLISKWFGNPNVRGTYSYHSMATERSKLSNKRLARAIKINKKPILQFAGEATNSKHYATVHGAVESGFREAKILRNFYK